jgi:CRISPR/Cas system Type II protein with McrA/HNH and RuvC-like nuclease domain
MDISDWTFCLRSFDLDDSEWGATVNEIPLTVADIGHSDKLVVFSFPPKVAALRARVDELVEKLAFAESMTLGAFDAALANGEERDIKKVRREAAEARVATLDGVISFYSAEVSARDSAMFAMRETIKEKDDRIEKLEAKNAEWEQKARGWLATPEAAKRLDGYREMASRVAELEDALLEIDKWQTGENNIEDDEDWEADEVLRRRVRAIVKQALAGRKEG